MSDRDMAWAEVDAALAVPFGQKPPLGHRPQWVAIEHWMADHPRLAWLAQPLRSFALWRWRRAFRRRHTNGFAS